MKFALWQVARPIEALTRRGPGETFYPCDAGTGEPFHIPHAADGVQGIISD
jgi:hypothetical protein